MLYTNYRMMNIAEFCTGTGAFSSAFAELNKVVGQSQYRTVYTNDIEPSSKTIFDLNHDIELTCKDIHDIDVNELPSFDIMTAGFPCQSFSIAGERLGFDDPRANVFWKLLEIIEHIQPRVVIFENVKNLQAHNNGTTFEIIKGCIEELGYKVKYKVMNTCEYTHIPQNRERIYIVCFKDEPAYELFEFPQPSHIPTLPITNFLESDINNKYYYNPSCAIYDKLVSGVTKSVMDSVVYQYRRYYVRENKNNVCPTLTANMGGGGHNVPIIRDEQGIRKLTPRECFNLQGFSNTYTLPNLADTKLYKLAGNAVTLPLVVRLVEELHNVLFRNV